MSERRLEDLKPGPVTVSVDHAADERDWTCRCIITKDKVITIPSRRDRQEPVEIRFYDADCYPRTWLNVIGHALIKLFSRRWVHVDIAAKGMVLAADMIKGKAIVVPESVWPEPALRIQLRTDPEHALAWIYRIEQQRLRYGWLDFCLAPLRRWVRINGGGVICSELTAQVIVDLATRHWASPDHYELARAIERRGAHTLTPADLYVLVRRYL